MTFARVAITSHPVRIENRTTYCRVAVEQVVRPIIKTEGAIRYARVVVVEQPVRVQVTRSYARVSVTEQITYVRVSTVGTQGARGLQGPQGEKGDTGSPGNGAEPPIVEVPAGVWDGTNRVFVLSQVPRSPEDLVVTLNGLTQRNDPDADYTLTGANIVFNPDAYPPSSPLDNFIARYIGEA